MILVRPTHAHLASYADAVQREWSWDEPDEESRRIALTAIKTSPDVFLEQFDDPEAKGPPVRLPDGSLVPRLPGVVRWMWDGEYCGTIGLCWMPGTTDLPPACLGHIGYGVVPWKRKRGCATAALAQLLPTAWEQGLSYVEVIADVENIASQRAILANGATLIERFPKLAANGGGEAFRFRIQP